VGDGVDQAVQAVVSNVHIHRVAVLVGSTVEGSPFLSGGIFSDTYLLAVFGVDEVGGLL